MKKIHLIIISIILIFIVGVIIYLNTYYKATDEVYGYLKSNDLVKVIKDKNGYLFDGPGKSEMFVLYPGAKVEYTSYAPLAHKLARKGVDTYIVDMPFNIAFFDTNAVMNVMKKYKYDKWYIGGHSLGGVVASMNVNKYKFSGLILLASYSTNKIDCRVLSIYGDRDGILNLNKYESSKNNYKKYVEVVINGGNHSYFGNYGEQNGDNKANISRNAQQERTISEIVKFINE